MSFDTSELLQQIGWTLIHSTWLFAAIAIGLLLTLKVLAHRSVQSRYLAACVALMLMTVTVPIAFIWTGTRPSSESIAGMRQYDGSLPSNPSIAMTGSNVQPTVNDANSFDLVDPSMATGAEAYLTIDQPINSASPIAAEDSRWTQRILELLHSNAERFALIWIACVLLFSLRPALGWYGIRRLRQVGIEPVDSEISLMVQRIAKHLGLTFSVQIVQSSQVKVPTVIGWLEPMILLPASAILGLTTEQMRDVITHELAHVRRMITW